MTAATRSIRPRLAVAAVAALAAGVTLSATADPALAATKLHATYKVTGSTYIKAPNFTLSLGPGKLSSTVNTTTGKLNTKTGAVHTKSKITLRIVSLTVAGVGVPVGNSCQTKDPVVVRLASKPGFNAIAGGTVAGSYTIGDFSHCELATLLINLTIPGSGNTITLKLGKAKIRR